MSDLLRSELPREPVCGGVARRLVEEFLSQHGLEQLSEDARIVTSELVNNAYLHGQGRIRLTLCVVRHGRVRIQASDEGEAEIKMREPDELGGHGLQIVNKLAADWGSAPSPTSVWAELTREPTPGAASEKKGSFSAAGCQA
jgi:anti-sigma regulatory factor (Ser/Thr protein kinase)